MKIDRSRMPRGLITAALVLGPLMQILDSTMMSVAMVHMQGSLQAAQDQIAWVLTSYLIAVAIMTPLWGAVSAHFGRKRLFLFAIAGFTFFAYLSGNADSLGAIIATRFLQGLFGAALVPLAQSTLLDTYPKEDYGIAMAWWGVGVMFGPMVGPTLGGFVTEFYSWRWAFWSNIPIGIVAFVMTLIFVPRPGPRKGRKFNYFGYIMLAVALASLQFVLDRGERFDWFSSPMIVILACVSASALWVFIVNSATSKHPFVDPTIFADRNFVVGLGLRVVFGIMLFGTLVLVPPFIQNMAGYPVLDAGLILGPRGLATIISVIIVGRLLKYVDARKIIAAGLATSAFAVWQMSLLTLDATWGWLVTLNVIQGAGFGLFFVPLSVCTFSTLSPEHRDVGTSFYALTGNIGRTSGIALLSGLLVRNTQANHEEMISNISPYNPLFDHIPLPDAWSLSDPAGLMALNTEITRQATLMAYSTDFLLLTGILIFFLPLLLLMRDPRKPANDVAPV